MWTGVREPRYTSLRIKVWSGVGAPQYSGFRRGVQTGLRGHPETQASGKRGAEWIRVTPIHRPQNRGVDLSQGTPPPIHKPHDKGTDWSWGTSILRLQDRGADWSVVAPQYIA